MPRRHHCLRAKREKQCAVAGGEFYSNGGASAKTTYMKIKFILVFLSLFFLNPSYSFAKDKNIREILNDIEAGKTIKDLENYKATSDGRFTFVKKVVPNAALYAVDDNPVLDDGSITFKNAILVIVDEGEFLIPDKSKLPKGKYKLVGSYNLYREDNAGEFMTTTIFIKIK
jgi:hypothetical protein